MAYTRWGAIGEQAGAGLQSGLDMALKNVMKQKQISQIAKKYGFDEEKIAGAMLGLPAVGGGASLNDQILYNVLKSQFPDLQMPTKASDPYAYYRSQSAQPAILNTPAENVQGQPSNNGVDQLMNQEILVIDKATGQKGYLPRAEFDSNLYEMVE